MYLPRYYKQTIVQRYNVLVRPKAGGPHTFIKDISRVYIVQVQVLSRQFRYIVRTALHNYNIYYLLCQAIIQHPMSVSPDRRRESLRFGAYNDLGGTALNSLRERLLK